MRRRAELFGEAAAIIGVSAYIAGELPARGRPRRRSVSTTAASRSARSPPEQAREPVVLFVGRFVEKKGFGDLLDAMARVRAAVPAVRLVVVGDGRPAARTRTPRRARELDATFAGWLPPDEVALQFREARVLCVPSRPPPTATPRGCPRPPRGRRAGTAGGRDAARRHPGGVGEEARARLVDEGDVDGLARELIAVLTDDELQRRLSAEARAHVERDFDPARQAEELEQIYDEVLGRATSR